MAIAAIVSTAAGEEGELAEPTGGGWHSVYQCPTRWARPLGERRSGPAQTREDHQIDVPTTGLTPLPELGSQSPLLLRKGLGFEVLQALMHQIQGVVDQLGGLFRGHGLGGEERVLDGIGSRGRLWGGL